MDVQFIKHLQAQPFSPARRIFVVQEMLQRLSDQEKNSWQASLEAILEIDRESLRLAFRFRRGRYTSPTCLQEQLVASQREGHRLFVQLLGELVESGEEPNAALLEPARQQLERLLNFSARQGSEAGAAQ